MVSSWKYFTEKDVLRHNCANDCWVSLWDNVLDITNVISENRGLLVEPLISYAGQDISHWFDKNSGNPKTCIDSETGLTMPYTPYGRYMPLPPNFPSTLWRHDFGDPWWNNMKYVIGKLTKKAILIKIVNVLLHSEDILLVSCEDTIFDIQQRYKDLNKHACSYTWKALCGDVFIPVEMEKNLVENNILDESISLELALVHSEIFKPTLHIYYNDDLTVA